MQSDSCASPKWNTMPFLAANFFSLCICHIIIEIKSSSSSNNKKLLTKKEKEKFYTENLLNEVYWYVQLIHMRINIRHTVGWKTKNSTRTTTTTKRSFSFSLSLFHNHFHCEIFSIRFFFVQKRIILTFRHCIRQPCIIIAFSVICDCRLFYNTLVKRERKRKKCEK